MSTCLARVPRTRNDLNKAIHLQDKKISLRVKYVCIYKISFSDLNENLKIEIYVLTKTTRLHKLTRNISLYKVEAKD